MIRCHLKPGVFALAVVVGLLSAPGQARAQTGPLLMLRPLGEGQSAEVQAQTMWLNTGAVETPGGGRFQLQRYESSGRLRLDPDGADTVRLGYQLAYLNLDHTDPALPQRLVDQEVAVGFEMDRWEDWRVQWVVGGGYAGNNPLADGKAYYARGDLILARKLNEEASIRLILSYDGNRTIWPDAPLPAVVYHRTVGEAWVLAVGVPFGSVTWRPHDRWTVVAEYWLPTTVNATVTYQPAEGIGLFAGFNDHTDAFRLEGDRDNRRLFFQQRRVEAGVRWNPDETWEVVVAGGYAFDQEFSRGFDVRDDTLVRRVTDEPYLRAGLTIHF